MHRISSNTFLQNNSNCEIFKNTIEHITHTITLTFFKFYTRNRMSCLPLWFIRERWGKDSNYVSLTHGETFIKIQISEKQIWTRNSSKLTKDLVINKYFRMFRILVRIILCQNMKHMFHLWTEYKFYIRTNWYFMFRFQESFRVDQNHITILEWI